MRKGGPKEREQGGVKRQNQDLTKRERAEAKLAILSCSPSRRSGSARKERSAPNPFSSLGAGSKNQERGARGGGGGSSNDNRGVARA